MDGSGAGEVDEEVVALSYLLWQTSSDAVLDQQLRVLGGRPPF